MMIPSIVIRRSILAAVASSPMLTAGAAHATIVSGIISGTIAGSTHDTYGLFGPAGGNLSGLAFTASYRYDTALAASYVRQSTFDAYLGTGDLTLSVTVNGVTVAPAGSTESEVIDTQDGADTQVTLANFAPTPLIDLVLLATGAWVPGDRIDAPFLLDTAYYQQTIYVSADGSHYDTLNFVGSSAPATAAPEPASFAILGAGLAALGCLCRYRRRSS